MTRFLPDTNCTVAVVSRWHSHHQDAANEIRQRRNRGEIMVVAAPSLIESVRKQYSIAQARDHLPGIVHEVERGSPVELTRRGKPVAVIVSIEEFRRLSGGRKTFTEAFEAWRQSVDLEELNFDPEEFLEGVRDKSPGREPKW